jgi:flagellar hook protein FlgE
MLRSMYTAINSLNLYQSYMDVIADNLANSNTTAFKASRVTFQDQMAQLISTGAAPSQNLGGINPIQIGLGSQIGSVSAVFTQGIMQSTGRSTDMAIEGDGFFIYSNGQQRFYSRDGALTIDAQGYLVNAGTGYRLLGWPAVASANGMVVDSNAPLRGMQIPLGSTLARATTAATMSGNLNADAAIGEVYTTAVSVYDSLGRVHNIEVNFTKTAEREWSVSGPDGDPSITVTGTLTFTDSGILEVPDPDNPPVITIHVPEDGTAAEINVTVDISTITQYATESTAAMASQDGLAAGGLIGFSVIADTGEILGVYSNGMKQLVGQVALATFVNPSGLMRSGQNTFTQSINSGEPTVGLAGTGGRGSVAAGYLEGSNVDLAQEFSSMILAQRGFQASSRIITTSDEMLQELVNLKR